MSVSQVSFSYFPKVIILLNPVYKMFLMTGQTFSRFIVTDYCFVIGYLNMISSPYCTLGSLFAFFCFASGKASKSVHFATTYMK